MQNQTKNCEHCKADFSISPDELSMYEKVGVELPTICFSCRVKHHFAFWSFGKFRKGVSALSGAPLITTLSEHTRYPIYTLKEWYTDAWDPLEYGRAYDPSRPFFDQLADLQAKVPRPHQTGTNNTACDWCDDVWNSKNCYLSRSMEECEDLSYVYRMFQCKNSIDCVMCFHCDGCYDSSYCHNSYNLAYSRNSRDCLDSYFVFDCRNSQNCFMCYNLRGKQYCIRNVQYSKEEYFLKLKEFQLDTYQAVQKFKKEFDLIIANNAVHRENFNIKTADSEGEFLIDTKNCKRCFIIHQSEDSYNSVRGAWQKNVIDVNGCWYMELSGNSSCCMSGYAVKYSLWSTSRFSEYVDHCIECENCFGSVGLRKKKYCILNIQYSKEEYEVLRERIISDMKTRGEYGKFLPFNMSTCPFNFSTASLHFPETKKEEIEKLGGWWEELNEGQIEGKSVGELPDSINDVEPSITKVPLICPVTGWRYNIAQNELQFYKQKIFRFHASISM